MAAGLQQDIKTKPYEQFVRKRFSNYMLMLLFAIGSISILFLAITVTYLFSKQLNADAPHLHMPPIFYVDTIILAIGSVSLILAKRAFDADNANAHKVSLYVGFLSGAAFLMGQVVGWYVLSSTGFTLTGHISASFLYVISGIHALHIVGGLIFLGYIFLNASRRLKDPALAVIYFSDPVPRAQLRLANYYWHFLGVLWLYLLIFFAIVK